MDENYQEQSQEEPQPEQWDGVSEPQPLFFEDYDKFVEARIQWAIEKNKPPIDATQADLIGAGVQRALQADRAAQAQAQAAAQAQAQRITPPYDDDPNQDQRAALTLRSVEYARESINAENLGKPKLAREWRERQAQVERDIAKLPPPPAVEFAQKVFEDRESRAIDLLYREDLADHPMWQDSKMENDSAVVVSQAIKRAKTTLRLPAEVSPFGDVSPCTPRNMVTVKLPEDQMEALQAMVASHGEMDPQTALRATWRALHTLGFAGSAKRALESREADEEPQGKTRKERDPSKMTQRQFEKWRESQGARRY